MHGTHRHHVAWVLLGMLALAALPAGTNPGCGAPAGENGGAGGVVPLGPSPTGGGVTNGDGGVSGDGDATANDNAADTAVNDNVVSPMNDNAADSGDSGEGGSDTPPANDNAADEGTDPAPFADACAAVTDRTFSIADRTLEFTGALFNWITSGGLVVGIFTCDGFSLLGLSSQDDQFVGSYDPRSDSVTWQGTIYLPNQ